MQLEKSKSVNNKCENPVENYKSLTTAEQTFIKQKKHNVIVMDLAGPVTHIRPVTAKLYSVRPHFEHNGKTPLQEFLEMKRAL
jgi:hypothetical protein